jgi:preprotein translocase subunit YajC
MVTLITAIIPFLYLIAVIVIIGWIFTIKRTNQKQVEQNNEIIELLQRLNDKLQG